MPDDAPACDHGRLLPASQQPPAERKRLARALRHGDAFACPACATTMQVIRPLGLELERCAACEAVWLDQGELHRLEQQRSIARTRDDRLDDLWSWVMVGL